MKISDEYAGKPLKMSVAKKLIIENFSGQTDVPRQDIMRTVDEQYFERGGKPSPNKIHPVVDALNSLKREGRANNQVYGKMVYLFKKGVRHLTKLRW